MMSSGTTPSLKSLYCLESTREDGVALLIMVGMSEG
jgi:hypothetical protein